MWYILVYLCIVWCIYTGIDVVATRLGTTRRDAEWGTYTQRPTTKNESSMHGGRPRCVHVCHVATSYFPQFATSSMYALKTCTYTEHDVLSHATLTEVGSPARTHNPVQTSLAGLHLHSQSLAGLGPLIALEDHYESFRGLQPSS